MIWANELGTGLIKIVSSRRPRVSRKSHHNCTGDTDTWLNLNGWRCCSLMPKYKAFVTGQREWVEPTSAVGWIWFWVGWRGRKLRRQVDLWMASAQSSAGLAVQVRPSPNQDCWSAQNVFRAFKRRHLFTTKKEEIPIAHSESCIRLLLLPQDSHFAIRKSED